MINLPKLFTLCLALALTGTVSAADMPGGYSPASVEDKDVVAAAAFAVAAQQEVLKVKGGKPTKLILIEIKEARQQVVAGINYWLRMKMAIDGEEKEAEVMVWWQSWRKPDPYRLMQWTWR